MRKEAKMAWIMLLIGCIAVFATYKILFPALPPPPPPVITPKVWYLEFEVISPVSLGPEDRQYFDVEEGLSVRIVEDRPKGGINAPTLKGTKTTFTRL